MKIEFVRTKNIYDFALILKPLVEDFGYVFYSTVFEWCHVIEYDFKKYWEFRLIKIDNKPSGCCGLYSLKENNTEELWLAWFGLIPELRNKRIGKQVLDYLEKEAKSKGCKYLLSYVDKEGKPLSFYKRNGFEIIGTVGEYLIQNDISEIDGQEFEDMKDFVIKKQL